MTLLNHTYLTVQLTPPDGLLALVGNTPLLPLRRVTLRLGSGQASGLSPRVRVFAKAEWFNPGGSIKDRPARNIILSALANGDLSNGKRLLDSTSGNMGISYATFGAALGIQVTLAVPSNASPERLSLLRTLGAEVIPTDPGEGSDGAILMARQLAAERPDRFWYANQYNNPANPQAHYLTTGPEILAQTNGEVTHFVAGLGTSGTLMGTGKYLREQLPQVKVISFEPDASFHGLEGLKHMPTAIRPGVYDESFADARLAVRTEAAHEMTRRLAREEGLFVGISSGAAAVAALEAASQLDEGVVVTVFPDAGHKYLSDKELWKGE